MRKQAGSQEFLRRSSGYGRGCSLNGSPIPGPCPLAGAMFSARLQGQKNRLADSHMPFLTNFRQSLGDYRISGIKPSVLMPGATFKAVRTEDSPNSYTATPRPKRTTFELIFGW
jgi:hypothetical protein